MKSKASTAASTDKTIAQLQLKIVDLETKVRFYEEQFNLLQHKRFGRSSEKPDTQAELFNEAESIIVEEEHTNHDDTEVDSSQITITYCAVPLYHPGLAPTYFIRNKQPDFTL